MVPSYANLFMVLFEEIHIISGNPYTSKIKLFRRYWHHHKLKSNVPYGHLRRIRKNCTTHSDFEEQSKVIYRRFEEKGCPKNFIKKAYTRAKNLSKENCLMKDLITNNSEKSKERNNLITTVGSEHYLIWRTLAKYWHILLRDPYLISLLPKTLQQKTVKRLIGNRFIKWPTPWEMEYSI